MNALKQNLLSAIDFLIKIESGPDAGKGFRIKPPKITVGRDPQCQIALTDPKVSRTQCVIKIANNVTCVDVSSRKTTLINGKPCGTTILKPGDVISFGQTKMKFMTRTSEKAKAQLPGQGGQPVVSKEKQEGRNHLYIFMGIILCLAATYKVLEKEPVAKKQVQLATTEDLKKQIEETNERSSLLRESYEEKKKLSQKKYLYQVEKHFITGFRDYQNGRYGRALDSFGTTIATDQNHSQAQQYAKTARKKREELIDTHLRDGQKYKSKLMYNRCAAEFEKAIVLINNNKSNKYELAKSQLEECRLLMSGGY